MGQYYTICNLDKKEFLDPHRFGTGIVLAGIGRTGDGVMSGLTILLALSGRGAHRGGPIYGRWAADRIAIIGDYFEGTVAGVAWDEDVNARVDDQLDGWVDISEHVIATLERDWEIRLPAPKGDASPRSFLHADGTITPFHRE